MFVNIDLFYVEIKKTQLCIEFWLEYILQMLRLSYIERSRNAQQDNSNAIC